MMFRKPKGLDCRLSLSAAASRTGTPAESSEVGPRNGGRPVQPGQATITATDATLGRLDEAVAALEPYMQEAVIPAGRVVNPLLDVWDAAHRIDPAVSSPVEQLLTALVERTSVTPKELISTVDEVRIAALQASVLVYAVVLV